MKIVFKTNELKKIFATIASCITQDKVNGFQNMYIKNSSDNIIYIRAMDSKHVIECHIKADSIDSFDEAYIPFFEINKFVPKFQGDTIIFNFKENDVLRVSSGKSYCQVSIKNLEQSNFVSEVIALKFENCLKLNKTIFQNIKNKLSGIASNDINRVTLTGICLDCFEGKLYFVSSDGKRLAVYNTNVDTTQFSSENKSYIIPVDSINSFCSICNEEQVNVYINDKYIKLENGDKKYYSTLINGQYPAYRKILSSTEKNTISVVVNKANLSNALSFINVNFQPFKKCDLSIQNNKFSLNFNNNESFEQFDVQFSDKVDVCINSQFLEKMVKPLNDEKIIMKFFNAQSPILIQADSIDMMLMPLKTR